jgi:hypothetical protein
MQNSHHDNHEPALAARAEKKYGGALENETGFPIWTNRAFQN